MEKVLPLLWCKQQIVDDGNDLEDSEGEGDGNDLEDGVSKAVRPRPHQCQHVGEAKQGDDDHLLKMQSSFFSKVKNCLLCK